MDLEAAFFKVQDGLPRQGPGSDNTTLRLYELAGKPLGTALDLGCGPGRAALVLARQGLHVTAVDLHQPYLDELDSMATDEGLDGNIITKNMSMEYVESLGESFDVVWSEAAAYSIGLQRALQAWKPVLKPNGVLVITELCWATETPSQAAIDFWHEEYPDMRSVDKIKALIADEGYDLLHTYELPESDWWDEYYSPLEKRHAELADIDDSTMKEVLAMSKREIAMRKHHANEYAYVGFIMHQKTM